ncbi:MAG: 4-oxalomesaconate tautomerase [Gammaproteobacteria bacterium]|nr:4-oxalomesaconate tautomerase [Gammaproteobacteria bacterium]
MTDGWHALPATLMRGGTSKGLYFRADALPADAAVRDRLLLAAMGSPDSRQIDGVGGAHPLTSKVAVVGPSADDAADVDYLFLQVAVDRPLVSSVQNCGNILAGVGPFAIEQGLVAAGDAETSVRIRMLNTGGIAVARVQTPGARVSYSGEARIDGVPGSAAPIMLDFEDVAGSSCGALLPTGNAVDRIAGIDATLIDNGMPVIVCRARDLGCEGDESPAELQADEGLKQRIEALRLAAGPMMRLGDVAEKTVPKISLISAGRHGGALTTRTFIPHRVHEAIGVLGAVSVATACLVPGSTACDIAGIGARQGNVRLDIEHPGGYFTVELALRSAADELVVERSAILRTARKLMEGTVFIAPEQHADDADA